MRRIIPVSPYKIVHYCKCGCMMKAESGYSNSSGSTWLHKCLRCDHREEIKNEKTGDIIYLTKEELSEME